MAVQDSTFKTAHVMDNEIVKANDFEFAFEQLVENVSKATQMFLESTQDFVINGKVLPDIGMNVKVSPIYGVCKSTGIPFGRTEETDETIGFEGSTSGRVDILEVQGDWETYDNQQRAFNDPDTDTKTYQYVDTKKLMKPVYRVKSGVEGAGVAPDVDDGWVKLAEVSIRAGVTTILASDIHNITADVAGLANEDWTNEEDITYNIGYISDVNARFRVQHEEDGTHSENSINAFSLDIGTGVNQINGNILPVGGSVSIPTESISATDSILSVFVKAASMITTLYNAYLKFGVYGFNDEIFISDLADADTHVLTKPLSIAAAGDGTAVIKIDGNAVLSIDVNGKLSTNGYTASSNNHIVTKAVTDGLNNLISGLDARVTAIENTSDTTVYANNTLSTGTGGRYKVDNTSIYLATTGNVTLTGTQSSSAMDNVTSIADGVYILVMKQTDSTQNGIWQYSSNSAWGRVTAYNSPEALIGKLFNVANGAVNAGKIFYMAKVHFTSPEAFGTDNIEFSEYFGSIKSLGNHLVMRDSNGDAYARNFCGNLCGNATSATCASKNGSGVAFGTAATLNKKAGVSAVTYVEYSGANGCCLLAGDFLAYWNGAYNSSGNSNLRYYCGGAFGTAAACAATAFRASDWTPTVVECANKGKNGSSYSAFGSNAFNSNSYLLTTGCAADSAKLGGKTASVASAASTVVLRDANQYICASYFNSNINDENINSYTDSPAIMFTSKDKWIRRTTKANLQTWLGLGSAAYANTSAFLGANGCAADSAKLGGTAASGYQKAVTEVNCCGIRFTVIYKTSHQMMFSFENASTSTINTCCMGKYMACFLASQGVKCMYGTMQGTARQGCGNAGSETWQLFWNGCAWTMSTPAQFSSRCLYRRVEDGEYGFQLESCGAGIMMANYITF